jgi:hypothetical protein
MTYQNFEVNLRKETSLDSLIWSQENPNGKRYFSKGSFAHSITSKNTKVISPEVENAVICHFDYINRDNLEKDKIEKTYNERLLLATMPELKHLSDEAQLLLSYAPKYLLDKDSYLDMLLQVIQDYEDGLFKFKLSSYDRFDSTIGFCLGDDGIIKSVRSIKDRSSWFINMDNFTEEADGYKSRYLLLATHATSD